MMMRAPAAGSAVARDLAIRMGVLSPAQLESFLERGFCVLENGFDRQLAEATVHRAYTRMGFTPGDPSSWANFDE
jgi:hypothetical protein